MLGRKAEEGWKLSMTDKGYSLSSLTAIMLPNSYYIGML